jgi:hypothetical protein
MRPLVLCAASLVLPPLAAPALADDAKADANGWFILVGPDGPHGWKAIPDGWQAAGAAYLDAGNLRRLAASGGRGVVYNGRAGRAPNLITSASYGDVEAHLEFLVSRGSNSGVKLAGLYEVQIADSYGVAKPTASHCGGIYPRAELLPRYHYLDEGFPPLVNAARPAGEWQTLDVVFRAPRFDASGKKVANARFVNVLLNGRVVQTDVDLDHPTGHAWHQKEPAAGPLLLQGDHGPVAFRNVRVRPLDKGPTP